MIKNIAYCFCLILLLTNCKGLKKVAESGKTVDAEKIKREMLKHQVKADWLSASAKVSVNGGGIAQSASATIRMQKDSLVWLSVKKIGFEIVRALITTDSVYVIDRFNRQYMANDLAFLSETYNLPANLETLQAILLGNPVFLSTSPLQLQEMENQYHLYNEGERKGDYWLDKEELLLRAMELNDKAENQKLNIQFKDYQQLPDNQFFSYFRVLSLDSKEVGEMSFELTYQKVEINEPKSIRFDIPKNYKKIE